MAIAQERRALKAAPVPAFGKVTKVSPLAVTLRGHSYSESDDLSVGASVKMYRTIVGISAGDSALVVWVSGDPVVVDIISDDDVPIEDTSVGHALLAAALDP